jgi:hypothetical protein
MEGPAMVNRICALTAALSLILSSFALAQERFGDKRIYHTIKSEAFPIADKEGHVLVVSETRGYDLQSGGNGVNRVVLDLVKGNGRSFGYGTLTEKDGDLLHYALEGKVSTVSDAAGKPATTAQGTWNSTGGTGKWKEREANGTWKNTAVDAQTSISEWEGTWRTKK